ncbi:MAG: nucleoside transporter C-terminal domain-containing protein [Candidatus Latescibacteria bacterium]|nr:nucleoside transporter C-terminal domain-containing protein [Candidatus Latescibacterota bacterium]
MPILHSAFGYLTLLAIAWLAGRRTRTIPWKTLGIATLLQLVLTGLLLQPAVRAPIFALVGRLTDLLKITALKANQSLLFGGISSEAFAREHGPVIALEIAAILIFVAALSRILYHYRILPWFIARLSRAMQKLMGISSAESVGVAANIFLGMTEAPLLIRPYVARLTESELFCLMTGGMATIAGTVMVIYATILGPVHPDVAGHLFVASLISAPAAIAVSKLMIPETAEAETAKDQVELPREDTLNGLDAAARGAAEGMHLVLNILAMLIAFIGLVALANWGVGRLDALVNDAPRGWSLQAFAGVLFHPFVWLMGIPWAEAGLVGELMGLKTILNEFVAYLALSQHVGDASALSQRSFVIATYALCGFANFGSVAIMIGGIGGIAPERRGDLARLGLRSLIGGTLATMLTGAVIGIYL